MATELTDKFVRELPPPTRGNQTIIYDSKVKGFGVRVTAAGARAFVLNFRTTGGRERRYTIAQFPDMTTRMAREKAGELKARIRDGHDPLAQIEGERKAPTVADLAARYAEKYLVGDAGGLRLSTRRNYRAMLDHEIVPALKHLKVREVTHSDIEGLHHQISKRAPYVANRVLQLLTRLFSLAIKWGWCAKNPVSGVERNREEKRHRYLSGEELTRLTTALASHPDQEAADVVRLLLLTGARRGEALGMRWDDLDLKVGTWTKPSHATKQKALHHVPLSAPACKLLARRLEEAKPGAEFVFPSPKNAQRSSGTRHRVDLERDWLALCRAADIKGARIHDLRHSYASWLANSGVSLQTIGALLGHSQPQTTARYAHLFIDTLQQATERVGAIVAGGPTAEVVQHPRARR
jgi:integrase